MNGLGVRSTLLRSARERWPSLAGPLLIFVAVLIVLHDFVFGGMITSQHHDILTVWLPEHCFLGKSLAKGNVPAWNPHVMGGAPFAADPQSGWAYLPAMLLYTALPCGVAVRWFFVLQPILGGLGTYWFLRSEGVSRSASTTGGAVLALGLSGSFLSASLPMSGSIAWTPLLLAAASRTLRAETWPGRFLWTSLTAVAWGQLASAHMSNGLAVGTVALVVYAVARIGADVRSGRRSLRASLLTAGLLVAALPLVNLAVFLPRLGYLPRSTLGLGYTRLLDLNETLAGGASKPFVAGQATLPAWPLKLVASPGTYLGAVPLAVALAGFWSRRHRRLAITFGVFGLLCYLAALKPVARGLSPLIRSLPMADFYLHRPWRFIVGVLVAMAVLAALGLEAWKQPRRPWERVAMMAPGVVVWGVLPLLVGIPPSRLAVAALGAAVGGTALIAGLFRPAVLLLVPLIVSVEITASDLLGQRAAGSPLASRGGYGLGRLPFGTTPLLAPTVRADEYLEAGPIVQMLRTEEAGRYLTRGGYVYTLRTEQWGALAGQRATLFGVEDAQGYNPLQPLRYWTYVRTVNTAPVKYNFAVLVDPRPATLDLLQVRWMVAPAGAAEVLGSRPIVGDRGWFLYERPEAVPRASAITRWSVADSPAEALEAVTSFGFDPSSALVVESDPGLTQAEGSHVTTASYEAVGTKEAEVTVDTSAPAIVLIRNVYDPNWRATVDGRDVEVFPANYFLLGVPVPPGRHSVVLEYDDPSVGYGAAGSLLALLLLLGAAATSGSRRRRTQMGQEEEESGRREPGPPPPEQDAEQKKTPAQRSHRDGHPRAERGKPEVP